MFVFAFPGMGKTTLANSYSEVVDLELSDIKYDNQKVSHLTKEERKSTKRPIKDKPYKKTYTDQAFSLDEQGKTVLVALNFFLRFWFLMLVSGRRNFHIFIPHPSLRREYRERYIKRGNNQRFISEVLLIWYPTTILFWLLSKQIPQVITVTQSQETLEDHYCPQAAILPKARVIKEVVAF
ncbi:MAG: hypothetical protein Q4D67_06085 [Streptococcus minor]|nr:hypothetical protein [Streptococcus minor]